MTTWCAGCGAEIRKFHEPYLKLEPFKNNSVKGFFTPGRSKHFHSEDCIEKYLISNRKPEAKE